MQEWNPDVHVGIYAALQSRKLTVKRQVQLLQTLLDAMRRFPNWKSGIFSLNEEDFVLVKDYANRFKTMLVSDRNNTNIPRLLAMISTILKFPTDRKTKERVTLSLPTVAVKEALAEILKEVDLVRASYRKEEDQKIDSVMRWIKLSNTCRFN